jgi:hypothetical protein
VGYRLKRNAQPSGATATICPIYLLVGSLIEFNFQKNSADMESYGHNQRDRDPSTGLARNVSVISTTSTILPAYEPRRAPSPDLSVIHSLHSFSTPSIRVMSPPPVHSYASTHTPSIHTDIERALSPSTHAPLLRAPPYRSTNSPGHSVWGDKYAQIPGNRLYGQPNRFGCLSNYGWRLWAMVVGVILVTMITIIVAVIMTSK